MKYEGKQLDEVWYEQEKEKLRNKELKAKELEAKINLGKQIESIVDSAGKKSGADNAASKAERVRNIRANRKNEKEEIRKKEAFTGRKSRQDEKAVQSAKELEISPIMQLIQQQVEEEIKDDALYNQSRIQGTADPGVSRKSID